MANCGRVLAKSSFYVNRKPLHIRLLRHGTFMSGGARFEDFLINSLEKEIINNSGSVKKDRILFERLFHGIQNVFLMAKGFYYSSADVNIVTARLALSSILRNLFSNRKTIIVLYNFDKDDSKRFYLKIYYNFLFGILKFNLKRTCIICQSTYFQQFFQDQFKKVPVYKVPNLFPAEKYKKHVDRDHKKILLGQYSHKNDESVFKLAKRLNDSGYHCYFLSLDARLSVKYTDYEVKSVSFDEYLNEMATSYCSIAFSKVKEGWNRMAHESILVGTPVIGYDRGGLGDLLRESGSYIVSSVDEAFELIASRKIELKASGDFIKRYDVSNTPMCLEPLIKFIYQDVK